MFELDSLCAMIGLQSGLTGLFAEQIVECRLDNRRIEANCHLALKCENAVDLKIFGTLS